MSNTIHIFHCSCGQRMSGRVLEQLAREASPCCSNCNQPLNRNELRYAANVKNNEWKGAHLLPAVFLSIGLTVLLFWSLWGVSQQAMPLVAMAIFGITILSALIFKKKGGSLTVALLAGMFFGPIAAVFLALCGPWRTMSAEEPNRQNNSEPSLDYLNTWFRK